MDRLHFIHTSDWHLGFSQYNRMERFNDYYLAANKTVEKIISLEPQFVLHTGDLFHHQHPSPGAIRQAVKLLGKLKESKIPIYMIRGNHDAKNSKHLQRGGNVISLLDDLNFIRYIDNTIVQPIENVNIYGVGYYTGSSALNYLESLIEETPPSSSTFDIVALHAFVEGQLERNIQISIKKLSELSVNYIGMGHYHLPWKREKHNIYVPGSSETTSTNDWNRTDLNNHISFYSSFYEGKAEYLNGSWSKIEILTHNIPVRPKIILSIKSEEKTLTAIKKEIIIEIQKKLEFISDMGFDPNSAIVKLTLHSDLDVELLSQISDEDIQEEVDIFHLMSRIEGNEKYADLEIDNYVNQNLEDIILDLTKGEDNPEYLMSIIVQLISEFGNTPVREPEDKTVDNIIALFNEQNNSNYLPSKVLSTEEIQNIITDDKKMEEWF